MHKHENETIKPKKYLGVIFLNLSISILEIIIGILSMSVALVSDAFHNLEDTVSLVISFLAWKISFKRPDENKTYGYKRAEVIAAFVNSLFLFAVCIFLMFESIRRLLSPEEVKGGWMMIMSAFALLANVVSVFILHSDSKENMNWRSAYLHMLGDSIFSLVIFFGALSIKLWSVYWIDPVLSILMCIFIIYQNWKIFKGSLDILMQSSPNLDYGSIKMDIENLSGVKNIHHVHSWMSNEDTIYFEAHIEVGECSVSESCDISRRIEEILKRKYGIHHTTLQFETDKCERKDMFYN
jgi:cobalt-zinc-cadmium efflux system protein